MKKEVLLDQMVDMMSTITEGTIRSSRIYYYVDPLKYPPTKLMRFILESIRINTGKYYKIKNIEPVIRLLTGRLYAKQTYNNSGTVSLDFYFTKKNYSQEKLISAISSANRASAEDPPFTRGSFLIDRENVSLNDVRTGKKVKYLRTQSERSDAVELEYLRDLNKKLKKSGAPVQLKIGNAIFEDVAEFIKNPDTNATADFIAIDSNAIKIPGTGISHKAPGFESYKNITSYVGGENATAKDVEDFLGAAESKWRQRLLYPSKGDDPLRPTSGFYRPTKKNKSRKIDLVYGQEGNRADYIVMGDFLIEKSGDITELVTAGEGRIYQYPEVPAQEYNPVFYSRFGSGGYKVEFSADELVELNKLFPELTADEFGKKLEEFGVSDIIIEQPNGIDTPIVISAKLSVRVFTIPQRRLPKKAEQI